MQLPLNEQVVLTAKSQNGVAVDSAAKKLKPADKAKLEKPGLLELSMDGKELVPEGRGQHAMVTFKKQPG